MIRGSSPSPVGRSAGPLGPPGVVACIVTGSPDTGRVSIWGRKVLLSLLVAAFAVQTWLVYSDDAGYATPPLSGPARRGQELWLRHNCQSCHQIYGYGGFLGPDLTNAAERLNRDRLEAALEELKQA